MEDELKQQMLEQIKMLFDIMKRDEFTDAVADFAWKMFTKLKAKGFTDEQAMGIVTNMSKPK